MAALSRQGTAVFPYKVGPDYIDPAFHAHIAGRPCRNLDGWLLPEPALRRLFCRTAQEDGLAVIEGVMGLFDGAGDGQEGSTSQVARILDAPIVLVVDAGGFSHSLAALVRGYDSFQPETRLSGVILNRVSGEKHYSRLKISIERACGIPCLGFLPARTDFSLKSRHLGLVPAQEIPDLDLRIQALAEAAGRFLDLPALLHLARSAPPLAPPPEDTRNRRTFPASVRPVRIGLARDAAFSFYYQDNLELLADLGATLVPFSPLADAHLPPDLHGLYLGGGFPEIFAPALARNASMLSAMASSLQAGLPCYAECGGLLYLTRSIAAKPASAGRERECGKPTTFPLVGFFPYHARMTARLQSFGYATLTLLRDTLLGPKGTCFRAHEFHYSLLEEISAPPDGFRVGGADPTGRITPVLSPVYTARKPDGSIRSGGLARGNTLALYPHLHFFSCPEAARAFVRICAGTAAGPEKKAPGGIP
jgi:cobyrinic acid a,c-diamide synthase